MKKIHAEVSLNQAIGLIGGWLIVYLSQPFLNELDKEQIATYYSVVFFCWSYTRSFIIRLLFEKASK